MMLLDEGERLLTLDKLQSTKVEVEKDLSKLPFNIETPSQIKHKLGYALLPTWLQTLLTRCREFFFNSKNFTQLSDDYLLSHSCWHRSLNSHGNSAT